MDIFVFLLFIVSLLLLSAGLMSPAALKKLYKTEFTRLNVSIIFGSAVILSFILFTFLTEQPQLTKEPQSDRIHTVTRVIDGDTLEVDDFGTTEAVRLIGIDAPEMVHPVRPMECFGVEAAGKAREMLLGEAVRLQPDATQGNRDGHDRLLRYVFLEDGTNFNRMMIKEGYAFEYTFNFPYIYQADFMEAQELAREAERGLWAADTCDGQREIRIAPGPGRPVKMSLTGICHAPGTTYYEITINFTPYAALQDCLDAGGRLPVR